MKNKEQLKGKEKKKEYGKKLLNTQQEISYTCVCVYIIMYAKSIVPGVLK